MVWECVRDHHGDADPSIATILALFEPTNASIGAASKLSHIDISAALHDTLLFQDFHHVAGDTASICRGAGHAKTTLASQHIQPRLHLGVIVGHILGYMKAEGLGAHRIVDFTPTRHGRRGLRPRIRVRLRYSRRRAVRRSRRQREIDHGLRGRHCFVVLSFYYFSLPIAMAFFSFNFFHDRIELEKRGFPLFFFYFCVLNCLFTECVWCV